MEDRRRKSVRGDACAGGDSAAVHRLPIDVLESIFLCLPSLLHLVRAACVCRRWRRVIADGCFLRSFRALRVPGLVADGYRVRERYHRLRPAGYDPIFFPSSTSPLKHDVDAGLGNFSLDFLPERGGEPWEIAARRGFLYLLLNEDTDGAAPPARFPDLVICEPFTGKHRAIPPLSAFESFDGFLCMGAFLLDGEEARAPWEFRVLCALYRYGVARACVFSSATGRWTVARCTSDCGMELLPGPHSILFAGQCATCAYWATTMSMGYTLLVLDKHAAELSSLSLPARMRPWMRYGVRVVRREHSAALVVCVTTAKLLEVFRHEADTGRWVLEAEVQLAEAVSWLPGFRERYLFAPWKIVSETNKGRVFLLAPWEDGWLISLDLDTMEFRLAAADGDNQCGLAHPYELPWPPVRPCSPV